MELHTIFYDEPAQERRGVDIALPPVVSSDTALFYVHGGGWYASSRDIYHKHLAFFSDRGYVCASAGYRTEQTTRLAEKMEDVVLGYDRFARFVRERYPQIRKIVVTGSSAGAHLSSLLALTGPEQWVSDKRIAADWHKPDGCISVNGPGTMVKWPDMNADIKKSIERLVGAAFEDESSAELFRQASPDTYIDASSPPFVFIIVGKEQFFPHPYVYAMSDKLRSAGVASEVVLYPDAAHGFFYDVANDLQKQAVLVMERFLEGIETKLGQAG